jgi:anti-sigma regulatory factor (Ser/Thr protein kinase)
MVLEVMECGPARRPDLGRRPVGGGSAARGDSPRGPTTAPPATSASRCHLARPTTQGSARHPMNAVPSGAPSAWRGYATARSVAGTPGRRVPGRAVPHRGVIAAAAEAGQVGTVRRFVAAHVSRWGLAEQDRDCAVLIVGELAANAARHGGASMTVSVSLDDRELCIEVVDGGPSPRDPSPRDPFALIDDDEEHGRGLGIVDQLASWTDISVEPNGWRIRAGLRVGVLADATTQTPTTAPSRHTPTDEGRSPG